MGILDTALLWRAKRAERLAAQKTVDALEVEEKALKQKVIDSLAKAKNKSVSNGDRLFQLVEDEVPKADGDTGWLKIQKHIQKTGEFELMERRLNTTAIKERRELGIKIPGVQWVPVEKLSDTAAK